MPYELCPGEPLPDALRRLADGELLAAQDELRSAAGDPVEAIHQARKRCKQARTILRLARGGALREEAYRRESLVIRNAARLVGGVRDAQVALQTLAALRRHETTHDPRLARALGPLAARLRGRQKAIVEAALGAEKRVETAVERLEVARARVPRWPLRGEGFASIRPGLEKLYRQGRGRLEAAARDPSTDRLHDLRKRVKDLWHVARILRPTWPGPLEAAGDAWHRLSDLLGDDHDLAGVRALAVSELGAEEGEVIVTIDARRTELVQDALGLGRRLFADHPGPFAHRYEVLWECWATEPPPGTQEDGA